jgi:hypothetical protein
MDAAPRGLAPGGPGVTGVPLVDWILADAGLAGAVLSYLVPRRDALRLRASCAGARAAVAGHGWDWAAEDLTWPRSPLPPLGDRLQAAASELVRSAWQTDVDRALVAKRWLRNPQNDIDITLDGPAALASWSACFPCARSVAVCGKGDVAVDADGDAVIAGGGGDDDATDAGVAALAAGGHTVRLRLVD